MPYERLIKEAENIPVEVHERSMVPTIKGLYGEGIVWINSNILTKIEKSCILAEELGHFHTSTGDITDQRDLRNRKQEKRARTWAYEKRVPLDGIVEASIAGVKGLHELAEFLEVTEIFLQEAINRYQEKYGLYTSVDEYLICFDPLYVLVIFE